MKKIICHMILLFALLFMTVKAQQPRVEKPPRYPNELSKLKLYQSAKWKNIVPHVSTRDEVEQIMGEPEPIYDQRFYDKKFNDYLVGYDYDSDWIVMISYIGEYGDLRHLVGRVFDIRLYPKKRISMEGVKFSSAFIPSSTIDRVHNEEFTEYYDKFGLYYSIYAKNSPDGQHLAGDLKLIKYDVADKEEESESAP